MDRILSLSCLLWCSCLLTVPVECPGETTTGLVKRAYTLTVQKKYSEAEQAYRQIADLDPAYGFPALARFLSLSGDSTSAAALLTDPRVANLSPLLRARTASGANLHEKAVEILRAPAAPDEQYAQASLLANELEILGRKNESRQALSEAIMQTTLAPADRRDLFTRLANSGESTAVQQLFPTILDQLIATSTLRFPELRQFAVDTLNTISSSPSAADFFRKLESSKDTSATLSWISALVSLKRGDVPNAQATIAAAMEKKTASQYQAILAEELARMTQDLDNAIALYKKALPLVGDPDRIRISLGQSLFKKHSFDEAAENLEHIRPEKLDEISRNIYQNMKMAVFGKKRSADETIQAYEQMADHFTWDRLRDISQATFSGAPDSAWARTLRSTLQSRLKETSAPVSLNALLAATQNYLHDPEGELAALHAYADANPDDMEAQQANADLTSTAAEQPAAAQKPANVESEKMKASADTAAAALWNIIKQQPYVPDNYVKLMELYKQYGDTEKARKTPLFLVPNDNVNPGDMELAAYLLATNGFPQDAVPLYEKALKRDPDDTKCRLNYAAALGRIGRIADAEAIYRDVIQHGSHGKQFHVHELYQSAFELAEQNKSLEQFVSFMKSLISDTTVAQHSQFLLDAGKLMLAHKRFDDAAAFFDALAKKYPERAGDAEQGLLDAYMAHGDYDKADGILAKQETASTNTTDLVATRLDRAFLMSKRGNTDAAVQQLQAIARQYPTERQATHGLINAAQLLIEKKQSQRAKDMLETYLSTNSGDIDGEQSAREMLAQLKTAEPPGAAVKAALEYTPAGR